MNKRSIAALFAPSVVLVLVMAVFVSAHADAQSAHTNPQFTFLNAHCEFDTLTHHHTWGFVRLDASPNGLQVTLSSAPGNGLSPRFLSFDVSGGSLGEGHHHAAAVSALGSDFQALHGHTHLSETISYYWNRFAELGYQATLESMTSSGSVYRFANATGQLRAEFSEQGRDIAVSVSWLPMVVASR